jgi:hypothetical protein
MEPDEASSGVAPVKAGRGYSLGKDHQMKDVLAVEAELLRSEGLDPAWPGFEADRKRRKKQEDN